MRMKFRVNLWADRINISTAIHIRMLVQCRKAVFSSFLGKLELQQEKIAISTSHKFDFIIRVEPAMA